MKNLFLGKWRITEMEQWDQEYIDLVVPGYFEFRKNNIGEFQFGIVEGDIDYRIEKVGDDKRLDFSWEGQEEYESLSGRGWATVEKNELIGRIFFHLGDDSWFKATRK
jgi:hypothetical protein